MIHICPIKSHEELYGKPKIIILVCPQNMTNWLFILIKNSVKRGIVLANVC
jgi:hypothetical protein